MKVYNNCVPESYKQNILQMENELKKFDRLWIKTFFEELGFQEFKKLFKQFSIKRSIRTATESKNSIGQYSLTKESRDLESFSSFKINSAICQRHHTVGEPTHFGHDLRSEEAYRKVLEKLSVSVGFSNVKIGLNAGYEKEMLQTIKKLVEEHKFQEGYMITSKATMKCKMTVQLFGNYDKYYVFYRKGGIFRSDPVDIDFQVEVPLPEEHTQLVDTKSLNVEKCIESQQPENEYLTLSSDIISLKQQELYGACEQGEYKVTKVVFLCTNGRKKNHRMRI